MMVPKPLLRPSSKDHPLQCRPANTLLCAWCVAGRRTRSDVSAQRPGTSGTLDPCAGAASPHVCKVAIASRMVGPRPRGCRLSQTATGSRRPAFRRRAALRNRAPDRRPSRRRYCGASGDRDIGAADIARVAVHDRGSRGFAAGLRPRCRGNSPPAAVASSWPPLPPWAVTYFECPGCRSAWQHVPSTTRSIACCQAIDWAMKLPRNRLRALSGVSAPVFGPERQSR